jgi:hypothetical protein
MSSLTEGDIHKAGRIDQVVRDYFAGHASVQEVPAKELMPEFLEKEIFTSNHRDGLPIRDFLRKLDAAGKLDLLKHVKVVRNKVNRNWYFHRST